MQIAVGLAIGGTVGVVVTDTLTTTLDVTPAPFLPRTVYDVLVKGETTIDVEVRTGTPSICNHTAGRKRSRVSRANKGR
jgi:hypothetical protein